MSKFAEQMTLTEVAAELGISRQRVKQIETAAFNKLRNNERVRVIYEGIIDGCDGGRNYLSDTHVDRFGDSRAR